MDNLTHSLIGFAAAESAVQLKKRSRHLTTENFRKVALLVSLLANNLPDLDFVYIRILQIFIPTDLKTASLCHHRGFTHTFLAALPQALLILGTLYLWSQKKLSTKLLKTEWVWLLTLATLGVILHIWADSWNSYGVHPLWPWSSKWYYGDSIFIVEPWIWVTLLPFTLLETKTRFIKFFLCALFILALNLVWFSGYVPWQIGIAITIWAFWFFGLQYKLPTKYRLGTSVFCFLIILISFNWFSYEIKSRVKLATTSDHPQNQLRDIVLSPFPGNPFCWWTIVTETNGDLYFARQGVAALLPKVIGAGQCPEFNFHPTVKLFPSTEALRPELIWQGEFRGTLSEMNRIKNLSCITKSFFKFTRVPVWQRYKQGIVLGDLRFDRSEKLEFGEILIADPTVSQTEIAQESSKDGDIDSQFANNPLHENNCHKWMPPWADQFPFEQE